MKTDPKKAVCTSGETMRDKWYKCILELKKQTLSLPHDSPCVSQICGVMQRAPPSRVSLVDVSSVLEQELAGD